MIQLEVSIPLRKRVVGTDVHTHTQWQILTVLLNGKWLWGWVSPQQLPFISRGEGKKKRDPGSQDPIKMQLWSGDLLLNRVFLVFLLDDHDHFDDLIFVLYKTIIFFVNQIIVHSNRGQVTLTPCYYFS